MVSFDEVVDAYDAGRPSYPGGVFDALGDLRGRIVLDVGAGTGIATRQLVGRGAVVVALDPGRAVLERAAARTAGLMAAVADGAKSPIRANAVDLVCFAQSWHWLAPDRRVGEAHRVLRRGGRWSGWWSHARADGEVWFDAYWSLIERTCAGTHRRQRDVDWGATLSDGALFDGPTRVVIPWVREVTTRAWMTDQASHSYIAVLIEPTRTDLLAGLRAIIDEAFPDGLMEVPYETWLWVATRR